MKLSQCTSPIMRGLFCRPTTFGGVVIAAGTFPTPRAQLTYSDGHPLIDSSARSSQVMSCPSSFAPRHPSMMPSPITPAPTTSFPPISGLQPCPEVPCVYGYFFSVTVPHSPGATSESRGLREPNRMRPLSTSKVTPPRNSSGPVRKASSPSAAFSATACPGLHWSIACWILPVSDLLSSRSGSADPCDASLAVSTLQDGGILGSATLRVSCPCAWGSAAEPANHPNTHPPATLANQVFIPTTLNKFVFFL